MSELLKQNLDILQKRWPSLANSLINTSIAHLDASIVSGLNQTISINGIQLSSRHDRQAEVELLVSQLDTQQTNVNLYGIGLGDIVKQLIQSPVLQQINITLLNISVFKLVLSYTDQTDWLQDLRCNLNLASMNAELVKPFISIPSEVVLADNEGAYLRNKILVHFQSQYAEKAHQNDNQEILKRFNDNLELIKQDSDVSELFNSSPDSPVFVVGTGPSLSGYLAPLKQLLSTNKPPIIVAVDTAMKPLLQVGITPNIVVTMDEVINETHLDIKHSRDIKLVYFPRLEKRVLQSWRGTRYVAYTSTQLYNTLRKKHYHSSLFAGGSVLHPAVDLAVKLGSKQIYLLGCDLSFPEGKTHSGWDDGELNMHIGAQAQHQWVYNNEGDKVTTSLSFLSYLESLEHYIHSTPQCQFININIKGAVIKGCRAIGTLEHE